VGETGDAGFGRDFTFGFTHSYVAHFNAPAAVEAVHRRAILALVRRTGGRTAMVDRVEPGRAHEDHRSAAIHRVAAEYPEAMPGFVVCASQTARWSRGRDVESASVGWNAEVARALSPLAEILRSPIAR